ncbi:hypothetical protein F4801DRAFT_90066 [Xylaria longipes]|nr:hypothetical protein F4801DRAFT_90066 [Xylaria longipes]RYC58050.1 hypothetical protein CHU98_g8159 [Xylaria longipes]
MQYLVLLASLLLGATASPVKQRQTTQAKVGYFTADTNPYGSGAFICYYLEIPGLVNTRCAYYDTTSDSTLPSVDQTYCYDPSVRWQFHQDPSIPGTEGQYRIVIIYTPTTGPAKSGFHEWAPSDFRQDLIGSTNETYYQGAIEFSVDLS